jgi:hypothetical protein
MPTASRSHNAVTPPNYRPMIPTLVRELSLSKTGRSRSSPRARRRNKRFSIAQTEATSSSPAPRSGTYKGPIPYLGPGPCLTTTNSFSPDGGA